MINKNVVNDSIDANKIVCFFYTFNSFRIRKRAGIKKKLRRDYIWAAVVILNHRELECSRQPFVKPFSHEFTLPRMFLLQFLLLLLLSLVVLLVAAVTILLIFVHRKI